jgi:phosphate transport system substrate-binding protein
MLKTSIATALLVSISLTAFSLGASAEDFKLSGSATVAKGIVIPNQAAIEAKSGVKLAVMVNGSGNGLVDVASGKSDIAMISAPMEAEAKLVNAKTPGALDISGLKVKAIGSAKINVIVNPANTAKLTSAQVKDIFSGKLKNWKEVGGSDSAILVVAEAAGNGTRTVVESVFLKGEIAASARIMTTLQQAADVVKQAPNAIGYGNASSITPAVTVVSGVDIAQPLALVTKGAPSATAAKVISAIAEFAK